VALAHAGAAGVRAAGPGADDTIGLRVQSRVYLSEGGGMIVVNDSTIPALVSFDPEPGWSVEPAEAVMQPGERMVAVVTGDGQDGAGIDVRASAASGPAPGTVGSVALLTARVYHEAPFDPAGLLGAVAPWAALAILAGLVLWRTKPWTLRLTRAAS